MKLQWLENRVVPVVIVSIVTFITLSTSVMAASKILGSFGQSAVRSSGELSLNAQDKKATDSAKKTSTATPTSTQKINTQKTISTPLKTSVKPINSVVRINTPTAILNNGNSNTGNCIVTILGKQYDVASLISSHSGGNIFACGTDMSAIYQSHHGTSVSLIAPYLVEGSGSSSPTQIPSPTVIISSVQNNGNISPVSNSNNCIVTIFGKQYNVTNLMNSHTGGNIFNCGTDMSAIYQSHHGTSVSLIASYLVTTSGSGSTGITSSPPSIQPTVALPRRRTRGDDGGDD